MPRIDCSSNWMAYATAALPSNDTIEWISMCNFPLYIASLIAILVLMHILYIDMLNRFECH